jgi:hypothetical protein
MDRRDALPAGGAVVSGASIVEVAVAIDRKDVRNSLLLLEATARSLAVLS